MGWWPLVSSVASSSSTPRRGVQGRWVVKERRRSWCGCLWFVLACWKPRPSATALRLCQRGNTSTSWQSENCTAGQILQVRHVSYENCLCTFTVRAAFQFVLRKVRTNTCRCQQHRCPNCTEEGVSQPKGGSCSHAAASQTRQHNNNNAAVSRQETRTLIGGAFLCQPPPSFPCPRHEGDCAAGGIVRGNLTCVESVGGVCNIKRGLQHSYQPLPSLPSPHHE